MEDCRVLGQLEVRDKGEEKDGDRISREIRREWKGDGKEGRIHEDK